MVDYFDEYEINLINQCYTEVDEVFCDIRKGVPQTKYVIEVKDCLVWYGHKEVKIPKYLVGMWMQQWETDNTRTNCSSRIGINDQHSEACPWVKVERVPVTTYEYQEV